MRCEMIEKRRVEVDRATAAASPHDERVFALSSGLVGHEQGVRRETACRGDAPHIERPCGTGIFDRYAARLSPSGDGPRESN